METEHHDKATIGVAELKDPDAVKEALSIMDDSSSVMCGNNKDNDKKYENKNLLEVKKEEENEEDDGKEKYLCRRRWKKTFNTLKKEPRKILRIFGESARLITLY